MSRKTKITKIITKLQQATTLHQNGQLDQARLIYEEILKIQPQNFDALHFLGVLEYQLDNAKLALEIIDKAIKIEPDNAAAFNNRGLAFHCLREFENALADFDKAIFLLPDFVDAYNNRGAALEDLKRFEEALASYEKAISLKPEYVSGHWNKSLLLLSSGRLTEGWIEFEWRWETKKLSPHKRYFKQLLWAGKESLVGKTILLHSEQGLGDTIQFSRYVNMVSNLGATVYFEIQRPLESLLKRLEGISQVIIKGNPLPSFDYHCPLLSLPLAFKTNINTIPSSIPYISSDPQKVGQWRVKLKDKQKYRVGLVWSGNQNQQNDHNRSIKLSKLLEYLPSQFQYVCLQKEIRNEDKQLLQAHPEILHFVDELSDFSDTAALCELMDIIISVDTSVAHLAGALGKSVWILLTYNPDWRWFLDRSDSPWYPTATLYRQESYGDWDSILAKVETDLVKRQLQ